MATDATFQYAGGPKEPYGPAVAAAEKAKVPIEEQVRYVDLNAIADRLTLLGNAVALAQETIAALTARIAELEAAAGGGPAPDPASPLTQVASPSEDARAFRLEEGFTLEDVLVTRTELVTY